MCTYHHRESLLKLSKRNKNEAKWTLSLHYISAVLPIARDGHLRRNTLVNLESVARLIIIMKKKPQRAKQSLLWQSNKYAHIRDIVTRKACRVITRVPVPSPFYPKSCGGSHKTGMSTAFSFTNKWWKVQDRRKTQELEMNKQKNKEKRKWDFLWLWYQWTTHPRTDNQVNCHQPFDKARHGNGFPIDQPHRMFCCWQQVHAFCFFDSLGDN